MASSILDSVVQSAVVSVAQGSADAFANAQLSTGISTAARYGWMLERIEFTFGNSLVSCPQTADIDVEVQVTQGQAPAALLSTASVDYITGVKFSVPGIAAAVNAYIMPLQYKWDAPENYVIVDPVLNFCVDSSLTAIIVQCVARIYYYPVPIAELDLLRMIALR